MDQRDRSERHEGEILVAATEARRLAARYVLHAGGDAQAALLQAVADGIATSRLVSRGYARWGKPQRRTGGS